jgi:hypothetical protein
MPVHGEKMIVFVHMDDILLHATKNKEINTFIETLKKEDIRI